MVQILSNPAYRSVFVTLVLTLRHIASGFKQYQRKIPNGESVPHPCKPNYIWQGVGHVNARGGGPRNPFGVDFDNAGKVWTVDLCRKDSDGDGLYNGQELGDPNCVWTEGKVPEITAGLSHPGVCEPFDGPSCVNRNTWVDCSVGEFKCEHLEKDADAFNVTVRYPQMPVPDAETTYLCLAFDFPQTDEYHMIAAQPIIDNVVVMHHMNVFGCNEDVPVTGVPFKCGMNNNPCRNILSGWTVGLTGRCFKPMLGYEVGRKGYKKGLLQVHWNNPEKISGYKDGSGMVLHLTPNKRQYNAGTLIIGQAYLELHPMKDKIEAKAELTSEISSFLIRNGSVFLTRGNNHMHYLGREMKIEHYRGDKKLRDITNDKSFSYDSPVDHFLDSVEFRAGDSLRTTCVYRTSSRSQTVFYGEDTSAEMCYGFIQYYPAENIPVTIGVNWKNLSFASMMVSYEANGCRFKEFLNASHPTTTQLYQRVMLNCKPLIGCLPECQQLARELRRHPCMTGDIGDYIRYTVSTGPTAYYNDLFRMFTALDSCGFQNDCSDKTTNKGHTIMNEYRMMVLILLSYLFSYQIR